MACWDLGPQTACSNTLTCDVVRIAPVKEKVHSPFLSLHHRVMLNHSQYLWRYGQDGQRASRQFADVENGTQNDLCLILFQNN